MDGSGNMRAQPAATCGFLTREGGIGDERGLDRQAIEGADTLPRLLFVEYVSHYFRAVNMKR